MKYSIFNKEKGKFDKSVVVDQDGNFLKIANGKTSSVKSPESYDLRMEDDNWIPAEKIGDYPQYHSNALSVIRLLVVIEVFDDVVVGWYIPTIKKWYVSGSPSSWNVKWFQPMPSKPK